MDSETRAKPHYKLRPVTTAVAGAGDKVGESSEAKSTAQDPFLRPAAEDDDGYDPFSDRPPAPEPTFQEDPWR